METAPEIIKQENSIISSLVINGDLSKLSPEQQVRYYNMFCESLGLNPLTKPFDLVSLSGKKVLYANKNCGEQLRKNNGVSILNLRQEVITDLCVTTVKGQDKTGRVDVETGAVNIKGLSGDSLANAMMKSATKAKRRLTLSLCSVGVLDETEIENIPGAVKTEINITGQTKQEQAKPDVKKENFGNCPDCGVNPCRCGKEKSASHTSTPSKVSEAARSQLLDLMNEMSYSPKKQELVFQKAEIVGEKAALEGVGKDYDKFCSTKAAESMAKIPKREEATNAETCF